VEWPQRSPPHDMPTVQLYANLRKIANIKELPIAGATLRSVLDGLVKEIPALDEVLLHDDQVRPHFVITINGHAASELDVAVADQDLIAIFPPIAGG
jgi:molybdopterin converting factor small subunit